MKKDWKAPRMKLVAHRLFKENLEIIDSVASRPMFLQFKDNETKPNKSAAMRYILLDWHYRQIINPGQDLTTKQLLSLYNENRKESK